MKYLVWSEDRWRNLIVTIEASIPKVSTASAGLLLFLPDIEFKLRQ
jgi:hypothetical protein